MPEFFNDFDEVGLAERPCDRFQLDYYTDINHWDEPTHRYCECGWTEAHHESTQT